MYDAPITMYFNRFVSNDITSKNDNFTSSVYTWKKEAKIDYINETAPAHFFKNIYQISHKKLMTPVLILTLLLTVSPFYYLIPSITEPLC